MTATSRTSAALAVLASLSLVTAGACTRTQQYVGTGAALGAGGGAIIGAATGGSAVGGALIGGAVGAGTGYVLSR
jgi:osmotically inducible lipoprotein OsmB